jgi:hypothetical protein
LEGGETAHLVIQMHYNNYANADDLTDDTRVELCTTSELRQHDAGVMSFGGTSFVLPPNATSELTCDFDVPTQAEPVMPVHLPERRRANPRRYELRLPEPAAVSDRRRHRRRRPRSDALYVGKLHQRGGPLR